MCQRLQKGQMLRKKQTFFFTPTVSKNVKSFVFGRRADRKCFFFCSDNWVPATCLPKGQSMSMDARNTRSRKAIETLSQAINEPTLKDLHAMLLSVIQRLDSIENDLLKRMTAVEESVENAHYRVSELEHQISSLDYSIRVGLRELVWGHSISYVDISLLLCFVSVEC